MVPQIISGWRGIYPGYPLMPQEAGFFAGVFGIRPRVDPPYIFQKNRGSGGSKNQ